MFKELTDKNFEEETSKGLKLVDFYTNWCKFCKNQQEVLEQLDDNFWIGKLDCDKYPDIARKYGIVGFPSFLVFKEGKLKTQFSGYHTKSQLLNKLTNVI